MKCPFCSAEIAEESRFCLYCMKSLNEKETISVYKKKKWWLKILTAILLISFAVSGICFFKENSENVPENNNDVVVNEEGILEDNNEALSDDIGREDVGEQGSSSEKPKDETVSTKDNEDSTTKPVDNTEENITLDSNIKEEVTESTTAPTTTTAVQNESIENVTWYYRDAYSSEYDKRYNKVETVNAITIIGFENIPSNGIFKIPETIDGKTVVSISMSNPNGYSFNDSEVRGKVRKVYLPLNLNKIETGTFSKCINMTDLYVAGEYLYVDPMSFPQKEERTGKLTIHSSDSSWCLYGSKYFNVYCSQYGANEYYASWKEWNGVI